MDNMKVSEQLKDFIKNYEKLELKTYQIYTPVAT
jgi:GH24 family phage-related lysozyme (muramidase)